jgi:quercetin dioxygenase-like cupin family protein
MGLLLFLAAQAAAPLAAPTVEIDVPEGHGPQSVQSHTREFAPGDSSGWHTHPGVEMGIVLSGEMEMRLADGTVRRFGPGQTFTIPRGTVHNGVNVADGPSRLAITYVYDKGKPVRTRVPEPAAR